MGHPRTTMLPCAEELVEMFRPHCERIEIAGSLRRCKGTVKDIEIVAIPSIPKDLFGNVTDKAPTDLDSFIHELVVEKRMELRLRVGGGKIASGPRFKALLYRKLALDLFLVRPPAQWGAVYAIRTGPWEFSKYLVTACKSMGLQCRDGALHRSDGSVVNTPEEEDFFKACGVPWVPPEDRK